MVYTVTHAGWLLINIAVVIGIVVLVFILMDIIFVGVFNRIFKKHSKGMAVVLNVECDNILHLYDVIKNSGIEIPESIIELVCSIQRNDLNNPGSEACNKAHKNLTYIRDELLYAARYHKELDNNEEFLLAKENTKQLDVQYRSTVAMYNADCLGYNYWISFLPTRWIWKMLKFKQRELINL